MNTEYDCVIVGGGPAGAIAAHSLARHGLKVVICDSSKRPVRRIGESLPGSARALLSRLELLHVLDGHSHSFGNLSAWGSSEVICTDFLMSPHGHGWHLDRVKFDRDLLNAAIEAGAELRVGEVNSASRLDAKWLLDCSGRRCFSSRYLGVDRIEDDDLTAVYGWFRAEDSDQRTLVESASEGWWYTSLVAENERVAAFHTSRARAEKIFRNPLEWQAQLSQTNHVGKLILQGRLQLHLAAANGGMLKKTASPGWLAAGDAAMTFDPISSQGLFNAIYTGQAAAEVVMGKTSLIDYEARLKSIREKYVQHQAYYYGQLARKNG